MQTYNIHEAKTHQSRLVDQAAKGEPFGGLRGRGINGGINVSMGTLYKYQ
jgi:hypothetical protein